MGCVIFDLDGTLADTSQDLIEAANVCFRSLGLGDLLDHADDAGTAFRGGRAMLRLGFARAGIHDEMAVDGQYRNLLEAYAGAIAVYTTFYPGAVDAVETLRRRGYRVGICTNKPEGLAETLLRTLGARDLFGSLVGADTLPVRKPDPAPFWAAVSRAGGDTAQALLVGDTETDRETARAAGAPSVLVTFGPNGDTVRDLAPEALMSGFDELPGIVKNLIR